MSLRTKLIFSIASSLLVIILIAIGITSIFASKKFIWNSKIDIHNDGQNLNFEIDGIVNGTQSFIANSDNGVIDNSSWEIPTTYTTFTKTNKLIVIQLVFTNKSSVSLRITLTNILFDSLNRFTTSATNESNMEYEITTTQATLGSLTTILDGGVGKTKIINLNYNLVNTNIPINGEEADTQNLVVTMSDVD